MTAGQKKTSNQEVTIILCHHPETTQTQSFCSDLFLFWLDQALGLAVDQLFQKEMGQETDKPLQEAPCFVLNHQFIKKVTYSAS